MPRVYVEKMASDIIIPTTITDAYKLSDIDSTEELSYYGYVDKDGRWYIMELTTTTARYARGTSDYTANWDLRGDLDYDYFYNVF